MRVAVDEVGSVNETIHETNGHGPWRDCLHNDDECVYGGNEEQNDDVIDDATDADARPRPASTIHTTNAF